MTLGFALLTLGSALMYTGLKNMTVADLALGRPGPGQPAPIVDPSAYALDGGTGGATTGAGGKVSPDTRAKGTGTWRGTKVAKWMLPILQKAVNAGWDGCLTSGYRTPEYSERLCQEMCGAPSCPGRCAGRSSNHSGTKYPGGAIDVCNPADFQAAMNKIGNPLKNSLGAADPNHFSVSGR